MELVHIPSESFSLKSWNDALAYIHHDYIFSRILL